MVEGGEVPVRVLQADSVIAAPVEEEVERAAQGLPAPEVTHSKAHAHTSAGGTADGPPDGHAAEVRRCDFETPRRQPDGVGPGAAAQLNHPAGTNRAVGQHTG